jgi:hypothetical protein
MLEWVCERFTGDCDGHPNPFKLAHLSRRTNFSPTHPVCEEESHTSLRILNTIMLLSSPQACLGERGNKFSDQAITTLRAAGAITFCVKLIIARQMHWDDCEYDSGPSALLGPLTQDTYRSWHLFCGRLNPTA